MVNVDISNRFRKCDRINENIIKYSRHDWSKWSIQISLSHLFSKEEKYPNIYINEIFIHFESELEKFKIESTPFDDKQIAVFDYKSARYKQAYSRYRSIYNWNQWPMGWLLFSNNISPEIVDYAIIRNCRSAISNYFIRWSASLLPFSIYGPSPRGLYVIQTRRTYSTLCFSCRDRYIRTRVHLFHRICL